MLCKGETMSRALIGDWKDLARDTALACKRGLLKQLRRNKGWTQSHLAKVAGYSERLICKAETGHPISLETIENLAEALSGENKTVYPEDLVVDPLLATHEIILLIQNLRAPAIEELQHWLDDEVELHVVGHRIVRQCPKISIGRSEVMSVLKFLWIEVGEHPLRLDDVHCVGSSLEVAVWSKLHCESLSADAIRSVQTCSLLEFRRGRIWRIELMIDAAAWRGLTTAS
jgi:transcriptional regulator with XRE-family HTH domain